MRKQILYATMGHTAAGKTTLSKYLISDSSLDLIYIEEGEIKRNLVKSYSTDDSLNEKLRDRAYTIAIDQANKVLKYGNVLIDASFHRLERRMIIYNMLLENLNSDSIIWLYCYCPNLEKVKERISRRKAAEKKAETQADSIRIYNHIINTFHYPKISEIPKDIHGAIIYINTDLNLIENVEFSTEYIVFRKKVEAICSKIMIQEQSWRQIN